MASTKMKRGIMCISLDTELFWGVHDTETYLSYGENVYNGHMKVVPRILGLFEEYGIHASWVVVGAIMARDKETLIKFLPSEDKWPRYNNSKRLPYKLIDEIGRSQEVDKLYLGIDVIEQIKNTKNQYIGSHTFSHYYCNESGQTIDQFEADLQSAINIADSVDVNMTSIVFPKNEMEESYIKSCRKMGFKVYRGIEENWIYKINNHSFLHRLLRFVDSYFPISGSNVFDPEFKNGLLNIRGSRILRPYNVKLKYFEKMKIRRIKQQMKKAAKKAKVFHLWWHPHNFGKNMEENFMNLKSILDYYVELNQKYDFQSKSMEEILTISGGENCDNI